MLLSICCDAEIYFESWISTKPKCSECKEYCGIYKDKEPPKKFEIDPNEQGV